MGTDEVYCIDCQKLVLAQGTISGITVHPFSFQTEYGYDYDWCDFPLGYAECEPPEFEEYWQDNLIEPSDEELAEMDENAEGLLRDLGLIYDSSYNEEDFPSFGSPD